MNGIVSALQLALSMFAAWFLYFLCWREYKVDAFRQKLFALRDDLFDYAQSGSIAFNDPAYTTLRSLLNGIIRFAHRMTFTRFVVLAASTKSQDNPMKAWMQDLRRLPPDVQEKLKKTHGDIGRAIALHVVAWSPLALILLAILVVVGALVSLLKLRIHIRVVRSSEDISSVLEKEALEQPDSYDQCLVAS